MRDLSLSYARKPRWTKTRGGVLSINKKHVRVGRTPMNKTMTVNKPFKSFRH